MTKGTEMKVRVTFINPVLGTASANKDLYRDYIASKAPNEEAREEEVESIDENDVEVKAMTVFSRLEDGTPHLWDYQIKGFFKNACGALRNADGTESSKIKSYKKHIDNLVFINERRIPLIFEGEIQNLQRPLRASTPQGERVALANSEMLPAGTTCEFTVKVLKADMMSTVREWLDYGELNGIGQWHNGGYGAFTWEEITE